MAKDFYFDIKKFSGLHFSSDSTLDLHDSESPEMMNFKLTEGDMLKRRDGYYSVYSPSGKVRGIWCGRLDSEEFSLAVIENTLYASKTDFETLLPVEGEVPGEEKVCFFLFYKALYLLTGERIVKFDGERVGEIEPYVPTLTISTTPDGAGVPYEDINLLTRVVRQKFSPDGESNRFRPVTNDIVGLHWIKIDGKEVDPDTYSWDDVRFDFLFNWVPPKGIDSMEVEYVIGGEDPSDRIQKCRFAMGFGGASDTRAFLYGNRDSAAIRYHSGIVEGKPSFEYFPETAYTLVGTGEEVTSILRHYNRQLIFTQNSAYYSYLEYMTGSDNKLIAAFPVLPLNEERGCVAKGQALLLENTPYTLTENGLYAWVSTNIQDERNAQCVSDLIAYALKKEKMEDAILFNRKATSELYLCIGDHLYVYHYRLKQYYYYEVCPILGFAQGAENLYFYNEKGIYCVGGDEDDGKVISAFWKSKLFSFGDRKKEKKLFGITIFAKTEGEEEMELSLRAENKELGESRKILLSGKKEHEKKKLRFSKRRFHLLQICIRSESKKPLHLLGLSLNGRIGENDG